MVTERRKFGDMGEMIAKRYLGQKGYTILESNYRKPYGEIDIIALQSKTLVFVEVKTRAVKNVSYFLPEQSVNYAKSKKLKKICQIYLLVKNGTGKIAPWAPGNFFD